MLVGAREDAKTARAEADRRRGWQRLGVDLLFWVVKIVWLIGKTKRRRGGRVYSALNEDGNAESGHSDDTSSIMHPLIHPIPYHKVSNAERGVLPECPSSISHGRKRHRSPSSKDAEPEKASAGASLI